MSDSAKKIADAAKNSAYFDRNLNKDCSDLKSSYPVIHKKVQTLFFQIFIKSPVALEQYDQFSQSCIQADTWALCHD